MKKIPVSPSRTLLSILIYFIQDHYKIFAWLISGMFLLSFFLIINELKVDNSLKIWFSDDDEAYETFLEFQEKYGNDDIVTVMLSYPHKVYEQAAVEDLLDMEAKLRTLEYVDQIYSYGSADYLKPSDSGFSLEKIVSRDPDDERENNEIRERLNHATRIKSSLISNN